MINTIGHRTLSFVLVMSCLFFKAFAATEIKIIDSEGNALPDAVIEITNGDSATVSETMIMDQVEKSFLPELLVIPKGAAVDFPNSDNVRHHVYSFSTPKIFEIRLYAEQPNAPIIFENAGAVVLGCNIHDSMVGYIYVTDSAHTYKSNKQGLISIASPVQDIAAITVWHPRISIGVDNRQSVSPDIFKSPQPVTITVDVNQPEKRDSFEDVFK